MKAATLAAFLAVSGLAAAQNYTTVALGDYNADYHTGSIFLGENEQYPVGLTTLGGVPFAIPATGNNIWSSQLDTDKTLTITGLSIPQATRVHMLINTLWGSNTGTATLTVTSGLGTVAVATLNGDDEMRDYLQNIYTNSINNTTTINVFKAGSGQQNEVRLDKFAFDLPAAFLTEGVASIQLVDNGAENFSRAFTAGITVEAVPEPASLGALGLGALALLRRRRRSLAKV